MVNTQMLDQLLCLRAKLVEIMTVKLVVKLKLRESVLHVTIPFLSLQAVARLVKRPTAMLVLDLVPQNVLLALPIIS